MSVAVASIEIIILSEVTRHAGAMYMAHFNYISHYSIKQLTLTKVGLYSQIQLSKPVFQWLLCQHRDHNVLISNNIASCSSSK